MKEILCSVFRGVVFASLTIEPPMVQDMLELRRVLVATTVEVSNASIGNPCDCSCFVSGPFGPWAEKTSTIHALGPE